MWKVIHGYIRYEISTDGEVRHRKFKRVLKGSKPYNGYLQVSVYNDKLKKRMSLCIHHLVALTFLGKRPLNYEIDHIDKNIENNKLSNLRYIYWRKNRNIRHKPLNICTVCGEKTKYEFYCSRKCRWLDIRILTTCNYCGKQFYRKKADQKKKTIERGYTIGRQYCSPQCNGLDRKGKPKKYIIK